MQKQTCEKAMHFEQVITIKIHIAKSSVVVITLNLQQQLLIIISEVRLTEAFKDSLTNLSVKVFWTIKLFGLQNINFT